MEQENKYLGSEKVSKLLLKFSIPCVLSLLVSALYNIVDQIFIGNSELGYLGNAATGIVFPITIIAVAFAWCFGDGTAAYLSICQGKQDTKNIHKCVGTGISVTFIVSIILMIVFFSFKESLLRLFGASDATIGLSIDYFNVLLSVFPFYMISNMMNSVIRADGSPAFSMASLLVGAILNIILDPIFIFGFHWGIKGAAYATIIGQLASFVLTFIYLFKTKTFKLALKSFVPDFKVFSNAVKLGVSTFITQIAIVIISLVCNIMLYKYGTLSIYGPDIPISVISIETKVFTVVINIVVGIIIGGQPILGYNYGARNYKRVKELFKIILTSTLTVGILSTLIFELCPRLVIGMFGKGSDLYNEFAVMTFRIFLSLVTFTCTIKMISIFFQAVGQPIKATVVSLSRDILFFVPLVIFLPTKFGIKGILFAAPIADFIAMIIATILLIGFWKTLSVEEKAITENVVIKPSHRGVILTINREHGSQGKHIGQIVAKKLGVECYYKETTALAAQESGLAKEFISDINQNAPAVLHDLYLSTNVVQQAIVAQAKIIKKIADEGSCVIIGRAANHVLREYDNVVNVFIYAPKDYRKKKIMEMYGDSEEEAIKSIKRSDEARGAYYKNITGENWANARNYDLCIDSSLGLEKTAQVICDYLKNI